MTFRLAIGIALVSGLLIVFGLWWRARSSRTARPNRTHIVLIGASIGQAWNLEEWPLRVHEPALTAESLAQWQFDKTESVDAVLLRPKVRFSLSRGWLRSFFRPPQTPDVVILKECSSYFPGPLSEYQKRMSQWVARLQQRRVRTILATVVPVTRDRARRDSGKQTALLEFNRWVREFARQQNLSLLDLEAALREETNAGYLREEFAAPDGSHLNAAAYVRLDQALRETLCRENAPLAEPIACQGERP